jgi:hypothetical protein
MDMPGFNSAVRQRWANATTDAAKTVLQRRIEANIEKERVTTLLHEGDDAIGPDDRLKCTFSTDGSWQKRYGRNSLRGYGVMYGLYTGLVCFVTRCDSGTQPRCRSGTRPAAIRGHKLFDIRVHNPLIFGYKTSLPFGDTTPLPFGDTTSLPFGDTTSLPFEDRTSMPFGDKSRCNSGTHFF